MKRELVFFCMYSEEKKKENSDPYCGVPPFNEGTTIESYFIKLLNYSGFITFRSRHGQ